MKYLKLILPHLDDIFVICGLIAVIIASYLINAILGTYILGVAFFVLAIITGKALQNPLIQKVIEKFINRR
jgi:hypothetical protein